jgi:hypothetical protein
VRGPFANAFFGAYVAASVALVTPVRAWEDHTPVTRLALQEFRWPALGGGFPNALVPIALGEAKKRALCDELKIQCGRLSWDWRGNSAVSAAQVLAIASQEPDGGMDQDLELAPYQATMGGTAGPASQAVRHMFFLPFTWEHPLDSFHWPLEAMGQATERAERYFNLALIYARNEQWFWAMRFLGWGLHYVQDLAQPYHCSQFGSVRLLAFGTLFRERSFEAFVKETTRVVGNFHLAFERAFDGELALDSPNGVKLAFRVPRLPKKLADAFLTPASGTASDALHGPLRGLSAHGRGQVAALVAAQELWLGAHLRAPGVELANAPESTGKVLSLGDENALRSGPLHEHAYNAFSAAGAVSRWYLESFFATLNFAPKE